MRGERERELRVGEGVGVERVLRVREMELIVRECELELLKRGI